MAKRKIPRQIPRPHSECDHPLYQGGTRVISPISAYTPIRKLTNQANLSDEFEAALFNLDAGIGLNRPSAQP